MNTIQIPSSYYSYNHNLPFAWQDVVRLEGSRNYTVFVLQNGQSYVSTKTISNYNPFLPSYFVRIHKRCIVNRQFITGFCTRQKMVFLSDGTVAQVARRRLSELLQTRSLGIKLTSEASLQP